MNTLSDIPPEVAGAANLVADWMKRNGHTRWELMEICSRNHAAELDQAKQENEALANLLWEHPTAPCDQDSVFQSMERVKQLREQIRNLLIQQAHEENIRAELKSELVALVAERDQLRAELESTKRCLVAREASLKAEGDAWVKAKEDCDQLRAEVDKLKGWLETETGRREAVAEMTIQRDQWRAVAEAAINAIPEIESSKFPADAFAAYEKLKGQP